MRNDVKTAPATPTKTEYEFAGGSPVPDPAVSDADMSNSITHDAVFGAVTEDGPNFRGVGWIPASVLMMKSQIGLGILSIPAAFDVLGLIPGVICLLTVGVMITWSMYMVGLFKMRHRGIWGIDDAGQLMFGAVGREVLGLAFTFHLVFGGGGSGMMGTAIGFNAVSSHGACTAVFVTISCVAVIILSSIRTLNRMSWLAWFGLTALLISVFMVAIAVGIQERPSAAPQEGEWVPDYKLFGHPSFTDAITAISTFIFAYGGTPLFFPIVAEMRDPRHYTRSMLVCQAVVTVCYLTIGVVVYYYCGSYVATPALGSAGKLIKKISYGVALPGLLATSTLNIHMASKYPFVRILRGSRHLTANTFTHWATWLGCVISMSLVGYIVASAIPGFGKLVALVGALFGTVLCFQPMGAMWFYDNWAEGRKSPTLRWRAMACWSALMIIVGTFLTIGGTYGAIVGIVNAYHTDPASRPWSCADNSNST